MTYLNQTNKNSPTFSQKSGKQKQVLEYLPQNVTQKVVTIDNKLKKVRPQRTPQRVTIDNLNYVVYDSHQDDADQIQNPLLLAD